MQIFIQPEVLRKAKLYLKEPKLWFCLTVYPAILVASEMLVKVTNVFLQEPLLFGAIVYLASFLVCSLTAWSVAQNLLKRDLQGAKLRMRRLKGIKTAP